MLRSIKYGLYGAVLAGLVGGTVAWTSVDKTVRVLVDDQSRSVHTTASNVADVLAAAGYSIGSHDLVAPSAQASVHDGSTIVFKRGRLLHLDIDGTLRDVWTTAPTVADAMAQLGYSTADFTSVSRSQRLPLGATDITLRTPKLITVRHDGRTDQVSSTDSTVGQLLSDLAITVGPRDRVSPSLSTPLGADTKIVITRINGRTVTITETLPFAVQSINDPSLYVGQTVVVTPGKTGTEQITYAYVYVDGKPVGRTPISSSVLQAPTTQVQKVGTKPVPAPPPVAAAPVAPAPSPGTAQAIAQKLVTQRGWGSDQFNCLVQIWDRESGWNVYAANSSGAYGIPQALPGSKMSSAGPNWQSDATTQITWGLGYIAGRYGTPCGAWSSWQANGWY